MAAAADKKVQEMKQEIAMYMRKKDYYDILGVQKTSDEAQIKKAYKKLALRFHPDKNNVEGAKAVFNKISNAYSNLIDPEKKASYDRYGPQQDRAPQYRPQRRYQQGYNPQDQYQQIFRAFFGGMGMGGAHQTRYNNNNFHHFTFNMGGPRNQNQQGNGGSNYIFFIIIIFVIYILPIFMQKQQPLFSLNPSSVYRFPLKTAKLQVPYYVREQYFKENKNGEYTKRIEREVDSSFLLELKKQCDKFQWSRAYTAAQTAAKQRYRQACLRFNQIQQKFPDYIRDLFYSF